MKLFYNISYCLQQDTYLSYFIDIHLDSVKARNIIIQIKNFIYAIRCF